MAVGVKEVLQARSIARAQRGFEACEPVVRDGNESLATGLHTGLESSYCAKRSTRLAARSAFPPSSAFSNSGLVRPAGSSPGSTVVAMIVMT